MIRVLIVDEVRLMRDAVAGVLDDQPDISVAGCATSVSQAISRAQDCDLVLVNANLPGNGAYRLARSFAPGSEKTAGKSRPRVVVLGLVESRASIVRWVEAGAQAYVCQDASVDELIENIRSAHRGDAHISPQVAGALMRRLAEFAAWFEELQASPMALSDLTPREKEVLQLLARDFSNQEIADHLVVEVGTVKNHVHNILSKLEVNSRHEAAMHLTAQKQPPELEAPELARRAKVAIA